MSPPDSSPPNPDAHRPDYAEVPPHDLVQVGFVFRPHGLQGELKIDPRATDAPARFEALPSVYIGARPHRVRRYPIASVRYQQTKRGVTVILGLDGIEDRDAAEAIAKRKVYATEEALGLDDEELFAHQLVDWAVVTEDGTRLGAVVTLREMPAQDAFVVRREDGREVMIPAVEDFIVALDEEAEQVVVRPIDGLLEE
jgi:16S rRNA processing protein RimM